jgi:hypothetical protein
MIFAHRLFGAGDAEVRRGAIDEILAMGQRLGMDHTAFYCETLEVLIRCRKALVGELDEASLMREIEAYERKNPDTYRFSIDIGQLGGSRLLLVMLLKLLIRERAAYRLIDRIMMNRLFSALYHLPLYMRKGDLPRFVNRASMNIDVFFS